MIFVKSDSDLQKNRRVRIQRIVEVTVAFLGAKGLAVVAPLLASNRLSLSDYGTLEYTIAFATLAGMVVTLGMTGALPYFSLTKVRAGYSGLILRYSVLVSVLLVIASLALGGVKALVAALTAAVVIQLVLSAWMKTSARQIEAVALDSGLLLVLATVLLLPTSGRELYTFQLLSVGYAVILAIIALKCADILPRHSSLERASREILEFSLPLVVSSSLVWFVTSSGRIIVEALFSLQDVAVYSFYFRLASVAVLGYQLVNLMIFRAVYAERADRLDLYFSLVLALATVGTCALFLLVPLFGSDWLTLLAETNVSSRPLYFVLSFQTIAWIAMALNEGVIYRSGKTSTLVLPMGLAVVAFIGLLFLLRNNLSLVMFSMIHLAFLFSLTQLQYFILRRSGITLHKTQFTVAAIALVFIAGWNVLF